MVRVANGLVKLALAATSKVGPARGSRCERVEESARFGPRSWRASFHRSRSKSCSILDPEDQPRIGSALEGVVKPAIGRYDLGRASRSESKTRMRQWQNLHSTLEAIYVRLIGSRQTVSAATAAMPRRLSS